MQERSCREHSQRKDYTVIAVEADEGLSGGSLNRPAFQRVLAMVQRGEADVIVLWKWSRFSRKRLDWYTALDLVESHGGRIESATEDIDTTTSVGRLSRGVLVELAAFERERISDQWREVWARRASLGLANGQPRFGYLLTDGQYLPDPELAPVIAQVLTDAVEGHSLRSLALRLNALGHLTPKGNPWQGPTLRTTLRTGFVAGLVKHKGVLLPGAHSPVVDPALWQRFMDLPTGPGGQDRSRKHLFSGLLRCAYCGGLLYAHSKPGVPNGTAYRCGTQDRKKACPGGGVVAWAPSIIPHVTEFIRGALLAQDAVYQEQVERWRALPRNDLAPLQRRLAKTETDLTSLARKNLDGFYDDPTYLALRADLLDTQRVLRKQVEELQADEPQPMDYLPLLRLWEAALNDTKRRHALTEVIDHIVVSKGDRTPARKYRIVPREW